MIKTVNLWVLVEAVGRRRAVQMGLRASHPSPTLLPPPCNSRKTTAEEDDFRSLKGVC